MSGCIKYLQCRADMLDTKSVYESDCMEKYLDTLAWDMPVHATWTLSSKFRLALPQKGKAGNRLTAVCMLLAPQLLQKPQVRTTLIPRPDMVCNENRSLTVTHAAGCVLDEGMKRKSLELRSQ